MKIWPEKTVEPSGQSSYTYDGRNHRCQNQKRDTYSQVVIAHEIVVQNRNMDRKNMMEGMAKRTQSRAYSIRLLRGRGIDDVEASLVDQPVLAEQVDAITA